MPGTAVPLWPDFAGWLPAIGSAGAKAYLDFAALAL
jgi:hypothetical protein